jgi:hypothetical protein
MPQSPELENLERRLSEKIREAEEALNGLKAKLASVHQVQALMSGEAETTGLDAKPAIKTTDNYAGLGASDALKKLLSDFPSKEFTSREALAALSRGGYKSDSSNTVVVISATFSRLVKSGFAKSSRRAGKAVYRKASGIHGSEASAGGV